MRGISRKRRNNLRYERNKCILGVKKTEKGGIGIINIANGYVIGWKGVNRRIQAQVKVIIDKEMQDNKIAERY